MTQNPCQKVNENKKTKKLKYNQIQKFVPQPINQSC